MRVYIPVKNQAEMTGKLLGQLAQQDGTHPVTILDNGSTEDIFGLCVEHQVEYIDCERMGIHDMWNRGLALSRGEHAAFLNNDIILHSDNVLERMENVLDDFPGIGVVSPYFGHPDHRSRLGLFPVRGIGAKGGCAGFCFAVSAELTRWYQFPKELSWYFGDADLFLTAESVGLETVIDRSIRIEHIDDGSVTTKAELEDADEIFQEDGRIFMGKWGTVLA